jgi:hypothetical protein
MNKSLLSLFVALAVLSFTYGLTEETSKSNLRRRLNGVDVDQQLVDEENVDLFELLDTDSENLELHIANAPLPPPPAHSALPPGVPPKLAPLGPPKLPPSGPPKLPPSGPPKPVAKGPSFLISVRSFP